MEQAKGKKKKHKLITLLIYTIVVLKCYDQ